MYYRTKATLMQQKINYFFQLFIIWFFLHNLAIVVDGLWDEKASCDIAVILGNTVQKDGRLSPRLKSRVDKGLEMYQQGWCKQLVVSGGFGKEGHWEGSAMAAYLQQKGVPASAIVIDNQGHNTQATAQNTLQYFPTSTSVMVISQYYHISRTKLAFQQAGFSKVNGVHADYFELRDFYSIFREFFGYYKYWLFP